MEKAEIDLSTKCRACLTTNLEMHFLFTEFDQGLTLANILYITAGFEVYEDDELPPYLCETCTTTLIEFHNFKSVYKDSENYIKTLLNSNFIVEKGNNVFKILENKTPSQIKTNIDAANYTTENDDINNFEDLFDDNFSEEKHFQLLNQSEENENSVEILNGTCYVNEITKKYACEECGDVFLMQTGFVEHMRKKHSQSDIDFKKCSTQIKVKRVVSSVDLNYEAEPSTEIKNLENFCKKCNISFANSGKYLEHKDRHKIHVCDICGSRFARNSDLIDHSKSHSTERTYKCPYCPRTYKARNGLSEHKRAKHVLPQANICDTCGKIFDYKSTMKTHIKLVHMKTRDFRCLICDLTFPMKQTLEKHTKRHRKGEHEHFCLECNKGYKDKSSLTRHNFENHNSEKVSFACDCGKEYKSQSHLLRHKRAHHGLNLKQDS